MEECNHVRHNVKQVVCPSCLDGIFSMCVTISRVCVSLSAPGSVRHLSFTEVLDTSLKVSWAEPEDKNGIVTG